MREVDGMCDEECPNLVFIEDEPYCSKLETFLPWYDGPLALCGGDE